MSARRAREPATRAAGAQGVPLALIHRTNSPNPALARVSARFEPKNGLPVAEVFAALRLPAALAFLMVRRLNDDYGN